MRDLGARVVEVHPVPPPLLRRLLLVRHAVSSQTTEREVAAMKGLWQVNLQLLHTGGDAFAVRRWGCSSWQACACTRVGLTGGAQGLAGGTLRARNNAARCTRCCPRAHRGIIWELHCIVNYVCASGATAHASAKGCAACSESQWQRTPTLSVASVVECPRLASIEASPELPGVSPKTRPQTKDGAATRREWRRGGNQQKEGGSKQMKTARSVSKFV